MVDEQHLPDLYADSINVTAGPFGFTLTLQVTDPVPGEETPPEHRVIGRIRLSPELAAALSRVLSEAHTLHRQKLAEAEKNDGSS